MKYIYTKEKKKKILQISPIDQVEYVYPLSDFSSGFYMGVYFNGKKYFKSNNFQ